MNGEGVGFGRTGAEVGRVVGDGVKGAGVGRGPTGAGVGRDGVGLAVRSGAGAGTKMHDASPVVNGVITDSSGASFS